MKWYSFLILLVLIVAANILWDWWRSGWLFCISLPRPYRDRPSQLAAWKRACSDEVMENADALLRTLCEAFSFNPDDRYCFAPSDRIMDICQACYPRWKFWTLADSLETESLMIDLCQQFAVEDESWHSDISLGEIVGLMRLPIEDSLATEHDEQ